MKSKISTQDPGEANFRSKNSKPESRNNSTQTTK